MQQRAERTRQAILQAARKLFAAGGFAGTSVDSIAEAASANKQRIYAYFGSKKKLFEAVLLDIFAENAENRCITMIPSGHWNAAAAIWYSR